MRAEVGAGERRVAGLGLVFAEDPGDPAAAEFAAVLADEQRVVVVAGPVEAVLGQVGAQQRRGVARRAGRGGSCGLCRSARPGAGACRRMSRTVRPANLGDPGGGVVEGGQQGRVAPASPGGPVGLGEQTGGSARR